MPNLFQRLGENVLAQVAVALLGLFGSAVLGGCGVWWWSVTVPDGAVVAFYLEDGCPTGWRPHDLSAGRVVVGVQDSPEASDPAIAFRDRGGSYSHRGENTTLSLGAENRDLVLASDPLANMPPFVAYRFCTPD